VKDRLKETDNEVNNLRLASKKSKLAFEEIKRSRLKEFNLCFESVAQRVDSIYVLGEKTNNLLVKKLSELIHGASIGQPVSNKASVTLVYRDQDSGRITRFQRFVLGQSSEYQIDDNIVSNQDYANRLEVMDKHFTRIYL